MSQEQPRRSQAGQQPIKYGDVFNVSGELLASKPITPKDAATMQSFETKTLGHIQKGGPAAAMEAASAKNVKAGLVDSDATNISEHDINISLANNVGNNQVIRESLNGQVVAEYMNPNEAQRDPPARAARDHHQMTIGEALERSGALAGDKPIEQCDAAAIQSAEMRAVVSKQTPITIVGRAAKSAADLNAQATRDEDKTKFSHVVEDGRDKIVKDKVVTQEDADRALIAELRNNRDRMNTNGGGVAETLLSAAKHNKNV